MQHLPVGQGKGGGGRAGGLNLAIGVLEDKEVPLNPSAIGNGGRKMFLVHSICWKGDWTEAIGLCPNLCKTVFHLECLLMSCD